MIYCKSTTKQNIMEAFWELYTVKKIEKITIKEIMIKAGYNRGTFYDYFKDVYDVLNEIEEMLLPDVTSIPTVSVSRKVMGMPIEQHLKWWQDNKQYLVVLCGANGDPYFVKRVKDTLKQALFDELVNQFPLNEVELSYMLEYTITGMIGVFVYYLEHDTEISEEKLIQIMTSFLSK